MIWPVPLLRFSDIKLWIKKPTNTHLLPHGYQSIYWRIGSAASLAEICEAISDQKGRTINLLLPGYFCGQSLRYLRNDTVRLLFYPLSEDYRPDYKYIEKGFSCHEIDVFLHVHYFSHIVCQSQSRQFADRYGAVLVEDCAHVLSPNLNKQWVGDYLLFSPHKHFALPPVSFVIARKSWLKNSELSAPFPLYWFIRQVIRYLVRVSPKARWRKTWSASAFQLKVFKPNERVICSTINHLNFDLEISSERKNRALRLIEILSTLPGWKPVQSTQVISSPYLCAMQCDSTQIARRRFFLLNKKNRLVMLWPDLPEEIKQLSEICQQSTEWVETTLFFFIHQNIDLNTWLFKINKIITKDGF